jgi:2-oxoisovalerate ferredoxin oxidoreductase delta subunit
MRQKRRIKKSGSKKKAAKTVHFKTYKDLPFCAMSLSSTLTNKTGVWRTLTPVVKQDLCISCLLCWKFCPEPCITMVDGIPVIDYDYCKGCGICAEVCVTKAIVMEEEKR